MKKGIRKTKKHKKLIDLFEQYQTFRKVSKMIPGHNLPPLTLDQQIESVNPYYVRNEVIKYGQ